ELFVGYRWLDQLPGAHAAGPDQDVYNRRWIGICLIGDGDRRPFTPAQLRRLTELLQALQERLGITEDRVLLHRQIAATTSPGRLFPEAEIREALLRSQRRSGTAKAMVSPPADSTTPSARPLRDAVGLDEL
ncbi:MAG: N-acetylmuramoyl-L-alanine amidase, partial [Planctomycetota bacterium]